MAGPSRGGAESRPARLRCTAVQRVRETVRRTGVVWPDGVCMEPARRWRKGQQMPSVRISAQPTLGTEIATTAGYIYPWIGPPRPSRANLAPLFRPLLLEKALEAALSVSGGTRAPAQAPLGPLFSVGGEGTDGTQDSARDLVQRSFGPVSFAALHLRASPPRRCNYPRRLCRL
jgi:hypothetical protein